MPQTPAHLGYLVLDTETNGFKEPRMAAIAMIFANSEFETEHEYRALIRPDGWEMSEQATKVNGLTMARLEEEGIPPLAPLHVFAAAVALGRTVVAHNLPFDMDIISREMGIAGMPAPSTDGICTMKGARSVGSKGSLEKAFETLTGGEIVDAHDALVDARACLAVLKELYLRGAV